MKKRYKRKLGEEMLEMFIVSQEIVDDTVKEYLSDILFGVSRNEKEINKLIEENLKQNWEIDRISKINLSLLKIAIYEMIYQKLPYRIAINEVVELAKRYSDEQAQSFINGVLASIVKKQNLEEE
jgi:N utilization substance protein B